MCQQELNGEKQWQEHTGTRKHKNAVHRDKKSKEGGVQIQKNKEKEKKSEHKEEIEFGLFEEDLM